MSIVVAPTIMRRTGPRGLQVPLTTIRHASEVNRTMQAVETLRSGLVARPFTAFVLLVMALGCATAGHAQELPFGPNFPELDSDATGQWWKQDSPRLMVPRDEVVAFAIYTHDRGTLKLTAQLYPLLPDESHEVRLELQRDGQWQRSCAGDG